MTLFKLFRSVFTDTAVDTQQVKTTVRAPSRLPISYPPLPGGLPVLSVSDVLQTQQDLVDRILRASATGERSSVEQARVLIERYAAFVHLLPATENSYFASAGGLLRLGLETAYYALRGTQQVIFSTDSADVRQHAEPRWRMAVLVAGLLRGMIETLPVMLVEQRGVVWQPVLEPLFSFLERTNTSHYLVQWQPPAGASVSSGLVGYVLPRIVPDSVISYLSSDKACLSALFETLGGGRVKEAENPIFKLVENVYQQVLERDMKRNAVYVQRPQVGARPEIDLLDAIRSLVDDGTWKVNVVGGRLWLWQGQLYLTERPGIPELRERLKKLGKSNVPADSRTLVEQLVLAKVVSTDTWWTVTPAGTRSSMVMLRLTDAELCLLDTSSVPKLESCSVLKGRNLKRSEQQAPAPGSVPDVRDEFVEHSSDSAPAQQGATANDAAAPTEPAPVPSPLPLPVSDQEADVQLIARRLNRAQDAGTKLSGGIDLERIHTAGADVFVPEPLLRELGINIAQLARALENEGWLATPADSTSKLTVIEGVKCVGIRGDIAKMLFQK